VTVTWDYTACDSISFDYMYRLMVVRNPSITIIKQFLGTERVREEYLLHYK